MRVGVVGCGLIGKRRADVVRRSPADQLAVVADVDRTRASALAADMGCQAATDWQEVVARQDVEVVVVATPNKYLMPICVAALESGKHVLCEKPPGRNMAETRRMVGAARRAGRFLKIGFNHRHHPAIWQAHELCNQGAIGPLLFIRAVYGHGGRPGYDKEWRGNADLAGGGELLDQGIHIVDLCRWFMGDFVEAFGVTATCFWELGHFRVGDDQQPAVDSGVPHDGKRQLEDNAFVTLRTTGGQVAQWHSSWTQWKNRFTFEIFGRDGYVCVDGLGGSYGVETLLVGRRRRESGPPIETKREFDGPDLSWQAEWDEFVSAIHEGREPMANGNDGLEAMRLIAAVYHSAHTGQPAYLDRMPLPS